MRGFRGSNQYTLKEKGKKVLAPPMLFIALRTPGGSLLPQWASAFHVQLVTWFQAKPLKGMSSERNGVETCVFASFFHLTKQTASYTGFMYHMFAFCRLSTLLIGIAFDWQINSSHEGNWLCCKIIQRTKETKTWRRKGQHSFF